MDATRSPFYLRFGLTLITIALLATGLHLGRAIFLPFFFSVLLATLLLPAVKFLQSKGIGKVLAIALCILVTMSLLFFIIYFLSTQIASFLQDFPEIEKRSKQLLWEVQKWVAENWNIGFREQKEYIEETAEQMNKPLAVKNTVLSITSVMSYVVFLPVYTSLILYHKDLIKNFMITVFKDGDEAKVRDLLQEAQVMSQQYITGLLIDLCIVFVLNSAGFMLLGIKYPIFLALVGALLNLVPYIGMIIANIICLLITLVAGNAPSDAILVAAVLAGVQLIDNNILMPFIVGNKVKLNALAIILGVLIAGALSGFPGMFLAIPALAVFKLILERVDHLKPWATLLGDEVTIEHEQKNPVKRALARARQRKQERKRNPAPRG